MALACRGYQQRELDEQLDEQLDELTGLDHRFGHRAMVRCADQSRASRTNGRHDDRRQLTKED